MGRLFLLFALIPIAEIAVLMRVNDQIGFLNTLALVIVTAMIGSYLAKREGFSILNKLQGKIASAQVPTDELVDGAIILVCGALLLTPGIITDVVGFLGLLPFTRGPIRTYLKKRFSSRIKTHNFPHQGSVRRSEDPEDITDLIEEKISAGV